MTGAVLVRELRRSFATTTAVDGASWAASAGTVTALLGPNGAGKTTTVECLEGLQRPDAGSVQVLGVDPWRSGPDHRARVGVMLQDGGLPTTSLGCRAVTGAVLVRELRRSFATTTAVDGASWAASAGTVTALLGPNGAGKTTTVECLEGLQRPDAGSVQVLGVDPWRSGPDHRARVGVMLQEGGLPTTSRPLPLLRHLAALYAEPAPLDELVARLGIEQFARTTVRRMSGGQRQRVALAAALLPRPDVLFLDEPTAGLDPHARLEVWDLVRAEADRGACVVVTTHSFEEAERLADRVVIMAAGRVVADGTLDEVRGGRSLEDVYFALTTRGPR